VDIGFIGLGHMGFAMAARLAGAGHRLVVYDTRDDVMKQAVASGSHAASSPRDVADRVDNVFASLPSLQASLDVATGSGVIAGSKVKRFIDLSTVGSSTAQRISQQLAERAIAMLDCPVSGGVHGATNGTLAMMVSGPRPEFEAGDIAGMGSRVSWPGPDQTRLTYRASSMSLRIRRPVTGVPQSASTP
jgi:3-hydroxyisobutyrate dehydrogenase-like beta-hydroxyacid dehydrogenase